jgi:hypothetical protein
MTEDTKALIYFGIITTVLTCLTTLLSGIANAWFNARFSEQFKQRQEIKAPLETNFSSEKTVKSNSATKTANLLQLTTLPYWTILLMNVLGSIIIGWEVAQTEPPTRIDVALIALGVGIICLGMVQNWLNAVIEVFNHNVESQR